MAKVAQFNTDVLEISQMIMEAQKPIHILDSIKWKDDIFEKFKASRFKEMPKADVDYYQKIPLYLNPEEKIQEFEYIRKLITERLGHEEPIIHILKRQCLEYEDVVRMLQVRGTREFYEYSKKLYGSASDVLGDKKTLLVDASVVINDILQNLENTDLGICYLKTIPSSEVVDILNKRLTQYFNDDVITVKLDDGILSDAAAGSNYIKIREGLMFSPREVDILETHEGWVHIGTTLNGLAQPYAKWLSKGTPSTTSIQEGLAFLMEVFTFRCTPDRLRKINNRLIGCEMAESGANFLQVFEHFINLGQSETNAFKNSQRIFRGGRIEGGAPFTKDISYTKGFIRTYNFLRTSVRNGHPHLIPYIFSGKLTLEDIPILYHYAQEGLIESPKYLPPQFSDLNGMAVWMTFSNFLNKMNLEKIGI